MLYTLEQGPTEKTIIEQCYRNNLPLPDKIANAPFLQFGLILYYQAFLELGNSRQLGAGGEGPISWRSIVDYCGYYELDAIQTDDMIYHIGEMDGVYLAHRAKQLVGKKVTKR